MDSKKNSEADAQGKPQPTESPKENPAIPRPIGASVGRIVHFFPNTDDKAARSNGNPGPVAALVTRVWGPALSDSINLTIFPDSAMPALRSSVPHKSAAAEGQSYWDWPARV